MSEITTIAEWVNTVSIGVLVVLILIGGYRRLWAWGYQLRAAEERADKYEKLFLRAVGVFSETLTGKKIGPTLSAQDLEEDE